MSEIETAMGLRRKHFIAVSLLVGSDHNLNGVHGVGLDTALRFVKNFPEDEVLDKYVCYSDIFSLFDCFLHQDYVCCHSGIYIAHLLIQVA